MTQPRRLRDLGPLARLGVAFAVLTLLGGTAASGLFLYLNQQNRDERPGLTIDDIKGHYHGITTRAPLLLAIEADHPRELTGAALPTADRDALIAWLSSDRLNQNYDNPDLGDLAPSEIMAVNCLDCHARDARGEHAAPAMPLEYWDDVQPLSISRQIQPVDLKILAASTHTHALGLAAVTIALMWLALLTSWPSAIVGLVVAATGVGLFLDIGSWWATRQIVEFAYLIAAAGAVYNGGMVILGLLVLADLLRPAGKPDQ